MSKGHLLLEDGSRYTGAPFGGGKSAEGEVVFNTGMVGYPETLTDPSYRGQILVFTQPMIGNYGVPPFKRDEWGLPVGFESDRIQATGVVITDLSHGAHHYTASRSFDKWLKEEGIPGLEGIDTRACTKRLREFGTMLGGVGSGKKKKSYKDPNLENLVAAVSIAEPVSYEAGKKKVIVLDCGAKASIIRSLLDRKVSVLRVPGDHDFLPALEGEADGLVITNGPGDPKMVLEAVERVGRATGVGKPIFGICLGNQVLALAAGFDTFKLKYGHRSQNQPAVEAGTGRALITSQNHGFAVDPDTRPRDWEIWFSNANDDTVEGIRHRRKPYFAVQFHPEATPGPMDAGYLFDDFVKLL
ncbi:MAG: glutamine-hydrolyzing carbamoyl-phosphate synthase small subunit [Planctomycetota bacterium]|jgi:carbamoyl-phosphate synthase small subunit